MNTSITLKIGSQLYTGWKEVSVRRAVDAISGSFRLLSAPRLVESDPLFPIMTGYQCEVKIGKHTVINGYVDVWEGGLEGSGNDVNISGRDRTGDLVDCSAELPAGGVRNQSLEQIVYALVKPYGLRVHIDTDTGERFSHFAVQQGETVFEAIERACRLRGVLPVSDSSGNIRLTEIGAQTAATNLVEGVNVRQFKHYCSMTNRFSSYRVLGQSASSDSFFGSKAVQVSAVTEDNVVGRHRPAKILAEGQVTRTTARKRAEWERAVRIGKSQTLTAVVPGWVQESGELWRPNYLVGAQCRSLHIPEMIQLLISSVSYSYTENDGEITTMVLTSPDAFIPEPKKKKTTSKTSTNPFAGLFE